MLTAAQKRAQQRWKTSPKGRAAAVRSATKYRKKLRAEILATLGGCCCRCGFDDPRALQVDHIAGGGVNERRIFKRSQSYDAFLLKNLNSGRYQLLCANCNWIKRHENSEWGNQHTGEEKR